MHFRRYQSVLLAPAAGARTAAALRESNLTEQ
jgi:hypothetical protein